MDPITALLNGLFGGHTHANTNHDYRHYTTHSARHAVHRHLSQEEYAGWFRQGGSRRGVASYYGRELAGHKTASGERFNPGAMTAAHRSLPMGTHVKVWHGGRSVVVRINDRGPFVRGRVLDLSSHAAHAIGCNGTCAISYEIL